VSTLQEIQDAVRKLAPEELSVFRRWFAEYDAEMWDRQAEADVASGTLDDVASEALEELAKDQTPGL
jgi:hypothetical protein